MTKIFAPPLDTMWRFLDDWTSPPAFMERRDNFETLHGEKGYMIPEWKKATGDNTDGESQGPNGWVARMNAWQDEQRRLRGVPQFVAGTIVVFDRYHISHSGDHAITLRVLISPEPLLTPRKQGGKMKGAGRIYLKVDELNTFPELEEVNDLS